MANADTDRNDLQREIGALTARVERLESLRQRFVDTGPSLAGASDAFARPETHERIGEIMVAR